MWRLVVTVVVVLMAIPAVGALHWRSSTASLVQQLVVHAQAPVENEESRCTGCLPEPVARFFAGAMKAGQPLIRRVDLVQDGEFFVNGAWHPLRARQRFTTSPPGMVWDARIRMAPLLSVHVRDGYVRGAGLMHAEFAAVYPMVDAQPTRELNEGALQRYLAEAGWFPTALLPGPTVSWAAHDANSAIVTLRDGETSVSLRYTFNAAGEVTEVYSPNRYREVNGSYIPTPWRGRTLEYGERGGFRIPTTLQVEWMLPEGPLPYWRGRVSSIHYEY